jgi:hypothetical protein
MLKDLMHNMLGGSIANAAQGSIMGGYPGHIGSSITTSQLPAQYNQIMQKDQLPKSKKLFHGTVEVLQVANGYIVNIGRKEGYEYETYIAETITDVNERIAAAIVAFQLESK